VLTKFLLTVVINFLDVFAWFSEKLFLIWVIRSSKKLAHKVLPLKEIHYYNESFLQIPHVIALTFFPHFFFFFFFTFLGAVVFSRHSIEKFQKKNEENEIIKKIM
jgi:hypothetical protein